MSERRSPPTKARRILGWTRDIAIALLVFGAIAFWREKDLATETAPPFTATLSDGSSVSLATLLEQHPDQPMLLHFWARWCAVCALMDGTINRLSDDYPVIGVAFQSGDATAVQAHMHRENLRFNSVIDDRGAIAGAYGVTAVPTSFILTPDGHIAAATAGLSTGWGLRLRLWWARWRWARQQ